jgi:hypothetical protein
LGFFLFLNERIIYYLKIVKILLNTHTLKFPILSLWY